MKIGLVLEGGAMRGMYTAGVLDIFLDKGFWVDGIISVSAGALFGVNYPSRQKGGQFVNNEEIYIQISVISVLKDFGEHRQYRE